MSFTTRVFLRVLSGHDGVCTGGHRGTRHDADGCARRHFQRAFPGRQRLADDLQSDGRIIAGTHGVCREQPHNRPSPPDRTPATAMDDVTSSAQCATTGCLHRRLFNGQRLSMQRDPFPRGRHRRALREPAHPHIPRRTLRRHVHVPFCLQKRGIDTHQERCQTALPRQSRHCRHCCIGMQLARCIYQDAPVFQLAQNFRPRGWHALERSEGRGQAFHQRFSRSTTTPFTPLRVAPGRATRPVSKPGCPWCINGKTQKSGGRFRPVRRSWFTWSWTASSKLAEPAS